MSGRTIVQGILWNSPYLGNVMSSQLALAAAVHERLGLGTHFLLAEGGDRQPWTAELEAAGATWSVLPRGRAARIHLDAVIRDTGAAVVHTHFTTADLVAARAARAAGVPCVWHVRTGFEGYPLGQRLKDLVKMRVVARRDVARIVAVSPWLADMLVHRGAPPDRIAEIPNAIALDRFDDLPSRDEARARFGLEPDTTVILGLGWWPEVKGVDILLDALDAVAPIHPEIQALLVGEEAMRTFVAARPRRPDWLRTAGFVENAAWLYAAADVFVSASRHEGQSSAVGEALACGLGVVISDIPGTSGWLAAPSVSSFPPGDSGALATRIEALLTTPAAERASAAAENRRWARSETGLDTWCDRLCDLYAGLLVR